MYVSLAVDNKLLDKIKQYRPDVVNEVLAASAGGGAPGAVASSGNLSAEAAQIQKWLKEGRIKAYNVGIGFEWWDEEAQAEFEALPFSEDLAETCGRVYRFPLVASGGDWVKYVVIVPQHMIIHRGDDGDERFDTVHLITIAEKDGGTALHPVNSSDDYFLDHGHTDHVLHLDEQKPFEWTNQPKTSWKQSGSYISTLGDSFYYTFEATDNPDVFTLQSYVNRVEPGYEDAKGVFEALPGITLPPLPGVEE